MVNNNEELDEAKAEIEKLKVELRDKTDSLQKLKKSHDAQVKQIQEAISIVEKLKQELLQKADEIINNRDRESIIKHLGAANDKLGADCDDEKFEKWEDENRRSVLVLEEANEKVENQDRQENECLLVLNKKCLDIEKNLETDDMFQKLEEENMKGEEQLKLKKEKFEHLEEAHKKLRDQFKSSMKEWELEKSTLLDEISSLKSKLNSHIRTSQGLQHQLQMCKQALVHEQSQRKHLEVEVSDLKVQFDDVSSEYQKAKLQLDCLNSQQDKDIDDLRYALKTQEGYYKESKHLAEKLEQENHELRMSLKELREAGASYSLSILRFSLRGLEQSHKEGVSIFKAREAEWSFKLEQLTETINRYQSELESKAATIEEFKMELECSNSLTIEMMLRNEEMSVMLLVLSQGIFEAQMKLSNDNIDMDLVNKEREEKYFQLMKKLEMKDAALISAEKDIDEEREKEASACLIAKELKYSPHKEPNKHKEMQEESTKCQLLLKEVLQMEIDLKEHLKEVYDALDKANIELDERTCERSEMEFELQMWKSFVEHLKNDLEENLVTRKALENSLLAQVDFSESLKQEKDSLVYKLEEEENRTNYLQQHVFLLEQELKAKETEASVPASGETVVSTEAVKGRYLPIMEEKDKILEELQKEVLRLEQESYRREFESAVIAKGNVERTNELEKENPIQFIKGKNMRRDELVQQVTSLEKEFISSLTYFSSQLAEKQAEIIQVQEACDKITTAEALAALEIEEKKLMIEELEDDILDIEQKLKLQDENWSQLKQFALDIETEMDAKQLRIKELTDQMENKLRGYDVLLQKLKMENTSLLESATRLSPERENLLGFVLGLCDKMCNCSTADTRVTDMLKSLVHSFEKDYEGMNFNKDDG